MKEFQKLQMLRIRDCSDILRQKIQRKGTVRRNAQESHKKNPCLLIALELVETIRTAPMTSFADIDLRTTGFQGNYINNYWNSITKNGV